MSRHETDREDLFAEATALVRRVELTGPHVSSTITAGFRRDGGLSIYFGGDPVFHLDRNSRLKRAFRDGRLYRTQGDTLAELVRERTPAGTILQRRDLTQNEAEDFLASMIDRLTELVVLVRTEGTVIARQHPQDDASFWSDVEAAVDAMTFDRRFEDMLAPRFKGKR